LFDDYGFERLERTLPIHSLYYILVYVGLYLVDEELNSFSADLLILFCRLLEEIIRSSFYNLLIDLSS